MKIPHYFIALALAVAGLSTSITTVYLSHSKKQTQIDLQKRQSEIQVELQRRQAEVNKGTLSSQVGGALLKDMANAALKNDKIKQLLSKNGYNLPAGESSSPGSK